MINEQEVLSQELHAPARKNYRRRKVVTLGPNETLQIDIVDMSKLASKNKGYKYMLTVIDTFSKVAHAVPLKTKSGLEVANAFEGILKTLDPPVKLVHADEGKEFLNANFESLLKKYNIKMYNTYSGLKASIVERFNRTLKTKMWRKFTELNSHNWLKILPQLIEDYNNTYHRTIKTKPSHVYKDIPAVRKLLKVEKSANKNSKFKVGDIVRVSKVRGIFAKGYLANWSEELFKISEVKTSVPVTYLLEDLAGEPLQGAFYNEELKKTKIPDYARIEKIIQRKTINGIPMVRVKWKGYENKFNSWLPLSETVKL